MKILFLTNNEISMKLFWWLKSEKNEDVILFKDLLDMETIKRNNPDFIISYNYKYIIKKEIIDYMENKIINLHISYLPWNRGASPNLWSFLENTPKGVTVHYIDEGLDTGNIIVQKELFFDEDKETLKSSYEKLHDEIQALFKDNWDEIKNSKKIPIQQDVTGTKHTIKDLNEIKVIINQWDLSIKELKEKYKCIKRGI